MQVVFSLWKLDKRVSFRHCEAYPLISTEWLLNVICLSLRQGFTLYPKLTSNSESSCLSSPSAGIIGMCHHAQLLGSGFNSCYIESECFKIACLY